jgi:hypothetical protein
VDIAYWSCIQHPCSASAAFIPISRFAHDELVQLIATIETMPIIVPSPYVMDKRMADAIKLADSERKVIRIRRDDMSNELFDALWSSSNPYPLVVTGHKMQHNWSPDLFSKLIGHNKCTVQNCKTKQVVDSTVGEFFGRYGAEREGRDVLRLKVPSSTVYFTYAA